ncbi:hypothetical protein [Pedobacter gandavensis]|uniref:hypothetical protein n=1 Tax=Pedobacter gandavensis TaxID=2679963 RepID=UPI00292F0DB2|nr:hypothetical protein [Pedobacter gandavensis]
MKKINLLVVILLFVFGIQSCKKTESIQKDQTQSEKKLPNSSQRLALQKFGNSLPQLNNSLEEFIGVAPPVTGAPATPPLTEAQAAALLAPLINNSGTLLNSYGFSNLEITEEYGSMNDPKVAILGLVLYVLNENDPDGPAMDCLITALGGDDIRDLLESTVERDFNTYGTRKLIMRAVGKVAARFGLGHLGTAIMIYEFMNCYWGVESGPGSMYPPIDPNTPLILPTPLQQTIYYTTNFSIIGTGLEPYPSTDLFYNPGDSKYYSDVSFNQQLQDAYYILNVDYNTGKYYQILNGKVVKIAYAKDGPPTPIGQPLLFPTPLPSMAYFTTVYTAIGNGFEPYSFSTGIFYSPYTGKYYSDSSLTVKLTDAFYILQEDYTSGKYYQVIDGKVVHIGHAQLPGDVPITPTPPVVQP